MRLNEPVTPHEIELPEGTLLVSKTDLAGRITFVNRAFTEISGYTESELMGAPHNLVRHPHMPPAAFADLWNTVKLGRPWEGVVKNRAKNGSFYWVRANVTPLTEGGQVVGYISVRTKPSREQVKAADTLYRDIREGRAGHIRLQEGEVLTAKTAARLNRFGRSLVGRILGMAVTLLLVSLAAAALGLKGMHDSNDALHDVYMDRVVPASHLAEIQGRLHDGLRQITLLTINPAASEPPRRLAEVLAAADKAWGQYAGNTLAPEERQLADRFAGQRKVLGEDGFNRALGLAKAGDAEGLDKLIGGVLLARFDETQATLKQLLDLQAEVARRQFDEANEDLRLHTIGGLVSVALGALAALLLAKILVRGVKGPLARMEEQFSAIARGDLLQDIQTEPVPEFTRANSMLRAMKAQLAFGLEERVETNRRAEEFLKREMLTLTEVLEGEVQETVGDISTQASRLSEGANKLSRVAAELREAGQSVTESVNTTAGNVQTVASATEELEASSREILSQVANSSRMAELARLRVDEASQRVAGLTEASNRIGSVVTMIQGIAAQTRMLALNATIEAARAGEVGKGFAVVAEEVKGLANQTEEGISGVSTQAEDIGRTTQETVDTVGAVASAIRDIDAIAAEVARSADEQRTATAEIMSSAVQAADHTRSVAERVNSMMEGVDATGATAHRVTELSSMVNRDIAALQRRLNVILRSSYGGDRRHAGRVPVAVRFKAQFEGRTFEGYTGDISPQGALLVLASKDHPGEGSGVVELDGVGRLEARLLSDSVVGVHVRFDNIGVNERRILAQRVATAEAADQPFVDLVQGVAAQATRQLEAALADHIIDQNALFDIDYAPIADTNPLQVIAKHTDLADQVFRPLIEPPLEHDPRIVFCCITDRNGYIAAHNKRYSEPQRPGEVVWNTAHSRNRRIFDDRTGILAARNTKPFLAQTYARDMGGGNFVLLKELDAPIAPLGRHWGAVRLALKLV